MTGSNFFDTSACRIIDGMITFVFILLYSLKGYSAGLVLQFLTLLIISLFIFWFRFINYMKRSFLKKLLNFFVRFVKEDKPCVLFIYFRHIDLILPLSTPIVTMVGAFCFASPKDCSFREFYRGACILCCMEPNDHVPSSTPLDRRASGDAVRLVGFTRGDQLFRPSASPKLHGTLAQVLAFLVLT